MSSTDVHPALSRLDHRPWPLPQGAWTWRQSWCDLAFAHWRVPVAQVQALVPPPLRVQERDGSAWIGVVPFRMQGVMRRPLPDVPGISAFPELNVRTYVEHRGRPGVWFFSLDATNALAVWAARRFFHLPYHRATVSIERDGEGFRYRQTRVAARASFEARYAPSGEPAEARGETLEHFLTERYCLYARRPDGALFRADVHHHPWPLQPAEMSIERNDVTAPLGLTLDGAPAHVCFARRVDVVVWSPQRVA